MSQQNPTIPTATQAKGIDASVNDLQTALSFDLSWLTNGMGRAYRKNKTRSNGASQFLPMVYLGTNFSNDFFNATPDNDKTGQSIILVGDATHLDYQTGFYGWLEYPISIIFSANLDTIDSALLATEDFTEHLMQDVRDSLRNLLGKSYRVAIVSETRDFEDVYSEFDIGVGTTNKPFLPMTYFRFECTLTVKEDCGNNVLDRCTAILQNLTSSDLLDCILPTYDFSDPTTQSAVTAQQQTDLIDWLCIATEFATYFNGIDESINLGNDASINFDYTDTFSFFTWVDITQGNLIQKYSSNMGWSFGVTPGSNLTFIMRTNFTFYLFITSTSTIPISGFSCVGFTHDGTGKASGMKLYINGVSAPFSVARDNVNASILVGTDVFLGKTDSAITSNLNGLQKTVSIWGTELSQSNVTDIYNLGRDNPDYTSIGTPISYYNLVALDPIDNEGVNNGTSVNMDEYNIVKI